MYAPTNAPGTKMPGAFIFAGMNMYFVAIVLPVELDQKVLKYKQFMIDKYGSAVGLKSPAHITLVPPFWLEADREPLLLEHFQRFQSTPRNFEVKLKGFGHFRKRVLFVAVDDNPNLDILQHETFDHIIEQFGDKVKKEEQRFHPHITLATRDLKPEAYDL